MLQAFSGTPASGEIATSQSACRLFHRFMICPTTLRSELILSAYRNLGRFSALSKNLAKPPCFKYLTTVFIERYDQFHLRIRASSDVTDRRRHWIGAGMAICARSGVRPPGGIQRPDDEFESGVLS